MSGGRAAVQWDVMFYTLASGAVAAVVWGWEGAAVCIVVGLLCCVLALEGEIDS